MSGNNGPHRFGRRERPYPTLYFAADCDCAASAIDFNSWNEATASYDGPRMSDEDVYLIRNTLAGAATIDEALILIYSSLSPVGASAISACYDQY